MFRSFLCFVCTLEMPLRMKLWISMDPHRIGCNLSCSRSSLKQKWKRRPEKHLSTHFRAEFRRAVTGDGEEVASAWLKIWRIMTCKLLFMRNGTIDSLSMSAKSHRNHSVVVDMHDVASQDVFAVRREVMESGSMRGSMFVVLRCKRANSLEFRFNN
jgi:hypothetical protein